MGTRQALTAVATPCHRTMRTPTFLKGIFANLLMSIAAVATPAAAQTISNTATLQWQAGATIVTTPSNQVDISVDTSVPALTLSTFEFSGDANAQKLNVGATMCRGAGGDVPITLPTAYQGTPLTPASVQPAIRIHAGDPLVVAIESPVDNKDTNVADTLAVVLTTTAGDAETIFLTETGANTGRFTGLVRTVAVPPQPVKGDCELSVRPGDTLNLSSTRLADGSLIATSPIEVLIDPFGVVFDSGNGNAVPGVSVTLIDDMTGQPAIVFGDDGMARFPATIVTGSTVTDSGGQTYAFPPGDYRFPLVRPGRYRLVVTPPAPYTAPSLSSPAQLAGLIRSDGLPFTLNAGSYGQPFTLSDPAPVRIDVPIDRPGAPLTLRKTASAAVASPGDAIQYRIVVTSGDAVRTTGAITISDRLPDTMRLKPGSVRTDGNKTSYSVTADGRRSHGIAVQPRWRQMPHAHLDLSCSKSGPTRSRATAVNRAAGRARQPRIAISAVAG